MNINITQIEKLISQGEGVSLEFKESRTAISKDVFETVCSFLNRQGGTILLGVRDNGEFIGCEPDNVEQIKRDFVNAVNNELKIAPPVYLSVDSLEIDNKIILHIYVPCSSQVHRCNGRIYDRNEDADIDITNNTNLVYSLYSRKQSSYSENRIYPLVKVSDLRSDLMAKSKKLADLHWDGHPWKNMDDSDFLKSAQLYQTDISTQQSGVTLAGILLLGDDHLILSAVPHHKTDLILRKSNLDRYDDRDIVQTNLIDSFDRIMGFVAKHLSDPFYLEETQRISLRSAIFREIASNILIHREYLNAFPAKLIIERGRVVTENSSKPHGIGLINPQNFTPFPKNPVIASFFRSLGRADELGSGMRKLMKYGKLYGGADPEMIEGDVFRIIMKYPDLRSDLEGITGQVTPTVTPTVTAQVLYLLTLIKNEGNLSSFEIRKLLSLKDKSHIHSAYLKPALKEGLIEMTLPEKPQSPLQKYRLTEKGINLLIKTN